jgi:hypothetical protein
MENKMGLDMYALSVRGNKPTRSVTAILILVFARAAGVAGL